MTGQLQTLLYVAAIALPPLPSAVLEDSETSAVSRSEEHSCVMSEKPFPVLRALKVDAGEQGEAVHISRAKMLGKETEQLFLSFRKGSVWVQSSFVCA